MTSAGPDSGEPILKVVFYRSQAGNEPVREWLLSLNRADRKTIGQDVKTAQYGWPLGMPAADLKTAQQRLIRLDEE
jgi:hypothetical protein